MGFLGGYFSSRDSFLVLLEALGSFWGFDFCPHSIILILEIYSPPPPLGLVTVLSSKKVDQNEARL